MGGMIYMKGGLKMNKCSIDKNYMNWLDVFTSKYCSFSDQDWIYGFNKLSESDMRNVIHSSDSYEHMLEEQQIYFG